MNLVKRCALALSLAGAAIGAQAATVTYDFSVFAIGGPASGSSSGWFSYDSSSVVAGTQVDQIGLLTGLSFDIGSVHWDETTANTGYLSFDASGALVDFEFGSNCTAGDNCTVSAGSDSFKVSFVNGFSYATSEAGYDSTYGGGVTDLTLRDVGGGGNLPEPASLALVLSAALLAYGSTRRRV